MEFPGNLVHPALDIMRVEPPQVGLEERLPCHLAGVDQGVALVAQQNKVRFAVRATFAAVVDVVNVSSGAGADPATPVVAVDHRATHLRWRVRLLLRGPGFFTANAAFRPSRVLRQALGRAERTEAHGDRFVSGDVLAASAATDLCHGSRIDRNRRPTQGRPSRCGV